jgi:heptosyltransferase-3
MRILVTRTDRLGDVILATPVLRHLRETRPGAEIHFLVRKEWMPVLAYGDAVKRVEFDPFESAGRLAERLRQTGFDEAYVLKDEALVSKAVMKAGIPFRAGPYSSFRSFFLFNHGRLQRRSRCKMHEAEYNLDLVSPRVPASRTEGLPRAWVETLPAAKTRAREFLGESQISPGTFVAIHPGSSGSARYVKQERLHGIAREWLAREVPVVVSGGPMEDAVLSRFKEAVPGVVLLGPQEGLGLDGLAEVYRCSRGVIAHGTGPLHLAAAVEVPVFAIYPPLFVLSEKRWGPLVSKRHVWIPAVVCPERFRCRGPACREYDCMDRFETDFALNTTEELFK